MTIMVYMAGKMRRTKGPRKTESNRTCPSSRNNRNWSHGKPPRFSDEKAEKHLEQKFWAKVLKMEQFHELQPETPLPKPPLVIDILLSLIVRFTSTRPELVTQLFGIPFHVY
ncbi:hypothetical protein FCM35_KLT09721 [Carex littledalei]|uniref:Uncharacterized protein n=1 Tax=Carex littledalei TaxID=544730 RepID=A0A833RHA4_9POAL|nr:hypothetical protein FCM35_KLT09721 [Carex littledalei]